VSKQVSQARSLRDGRWVKPQRTQGTQSREFISRNGQGHVRQGNKSPIRGFLFLCPTFLCLVFKLENGETLEIRSTRELYCRASLRIVGAKRRSAMAIKWMSELSQGFLPAERLCFGAS
jgi:hypothetical protein